MAAVILKRASNPASKLLERILSNPSQTFAPSSSAVRSFNTNVQMSPEEGDSSERSSNIAHRRSDAPSRRRPGGLSRRRFRRGDDEYPAVFSADAFDPFNPASRSLSQVLNMMDQMMDLPVFSAVQQQQQRGWEAREEEDALHLRVDMPGLGKEHVRVSAEGSTLIIHGESEEEENTDDADGTERKKRRRYRSRIDLPGDVYKMDGIRAEMKNGVLMVTVPKVKEERRDDVHQVQIE